MRLVLVCHEFLPIGGGGSVVTWQLARALARGGDEVEVLTAGYGDLAPHEECSGFTVHRLAVRRTATHGSGVRDMLSFVRAAAQVLSARPRRHDAALAVFSLPSGVATWMARRRNQLPYVAYLGGSDVPGHDPTRFRFVYPVARPIARRVWRDAAAVVACSEGLRRLALASAPRAHIQLVPDGVDTDAYTPRLEPRAPGPPRVLFVGRLVKRKAADVLLDAAAAALAAGARFDLEIVGDGPERGTLEAQAVRLGLGAVVRFTGQVPYEALAAVMRRADLFVLPSLAEGMACVVLEAMGTGLPVLTTRVAGNDELITPGVNGELTPPSDAAALGRALGKLVGIGAPGLAEMGKRSREVALGYDWRRIAVRYRELLAAAARGPASS